MCVCSYVCVRWISIAYLDLVGGLVLVLERAVLVAGAVHAHDGDGLLLQTLQLGGGGHRDQSSDDQLETRGHGRSGHWTELG